MNVLLLFLGWFQDLVKCNVISYYCLQRLRKGRGRYLKRAQ